MSKSKIMNFADGPKEIFVGQIVVSDNGQSGAHHKRLYTYTVESIGSKLVTMTDSDKFYLETGKKQTEYTWGRLYSSAEAYNTEEKNEEIIRSVKRYFSDNNSKLTVEQALKIREILGIK